MSPFAFALCRALIEHQFQVSARAKELSRPSDVDRRLITYADLCKRAGRAGDERSIGPYLLEVAEWCAAQNRPPLNALVVSATMRRPSDGYSEAPGCVNWGDDVRRVLTCESYPDAKG